MRNPSPGLAPDKQQLFYEKEQLFPSGKTWNGYAFREIQIGQKLWKDIILILKPATWRESRNVLFSREFES